MRERVSDLREEVGDVEALSDESEKALESFALLGIELAVEERSDVDVFGVVVEVSVGADPEHRRRRLAQRFRRRSELREHRFVFVFVFSVLPLYSMPPSRKQNVLIEICFFLLWFWLVPTEG